MDETSKRENSLWWIKPANRSKLESAPTDSNLESPSAEIASSIAEFLAQERACLNSGGGDGSDVDIKSILDEINRLSSETPIPGATYVFDEGGGDRSIDDILKEVEKLSEESSVSIRELCSSSKTSLKSFKNEKCFPRKSVKSVPSDNEETSISEDLDSMEIVNSLKELNSQKPMDSQKRDDVDVPNPKNITTENYNYNENEDSDSKSSSDTLNDRYNSNLDLDMTENEVESLKYNETYEMDFENENLETLDERLHSTTNGVDAGEMCTLENEDARDLRLTFVHHDIVGNVENVEDLNESQRLMSPHVESVCSDRATSPVWQESGMSRDRMKLLASEERVKELQERLQAVSMQHNSLASSHRNLSMQHSELQTKTNALEAEIIRLQEALKTSTEQIQRHLLVTEQLRETNNTLQTQLQAERSNRKAAVNQEEQQKRNIQDLQRQVREMERILARKHPDSVSALIVASKSATTPVDDTARKLLEDRIVQLENAAKTQTSKSQTVLQTVQEKFNAMQLKYEAHIADLESQVFSLQQINLDYQQKEINGNKLLMDTEMQTDLEYYEMNKIYVNSSTQTMKPSPKIIPNKNTKQNLSHNQVAHKEDTHLLATIRGLNLELSGKDKSLQKMTRELEDCKKTIKRLQRDREVVLKNPHPSEKHKEYDPQQFTVNGNEEAILSSRTFELLQRDYHTLVEKRLQDLNTLQHAHERELAGLEGTIDALRTRLRERDATISSLKGQIKDKVAALEKRHADREKTLKTLVKTLSTTKNSSGWMKL